MVMSGSCSLLLLQVHLWDPGGALGPADSDQALHLVLEELSSLPEATFLSICGWRVWPQACAEVKRRHTFLFCVFVSCVPAHPDC